MKKLLTICIPTYKRPITLRRCIDSIVSQIEEFSLSDCVDICVTNDASPDDTVDVLQSYASLDYFNGISREHNLGMNVNIKTMFEEVIENSEYQLIVTDDDYLQPHVLGDIAEFLLKQQCDNNVAAIWTPRYSYTEDGELHCVVCNPFKISRPVKPSATNAGRYMNNGFVLSGLILRAESIDYDFWEEYSENGYFPMICFGELLCRSGAYYWNKNIVHHTVLNECHWERWGKNDVVIRMKLFTDYVNTYGIFSKRIIKSSQVILFYIAAFRGIRGAINSLFATNVWRGDRQLLLTSINEFKAQDVPKLALQLRLMMVCALVLYLVTSTIKFMAHLTLMLLTPDGNKKKRHSNANSNLWEGLRSTPAVFKLILS